MLVLLFAPSLAVLIDLLRARFAVPKAWIYTLAVLMAIPCLLVWALGYSYSNIQHDHLALTLCITAVLMTLMAFDEGGLSGKIKGALILTIILMIGVTVGLIQRVYSGEDKIYSTTIYQSYIGIHGRDYSPVLSGPERITIKKTRVNGLVERTLVTKAFSTKDSLWANCLFRFSDEGKAFRFDHCRKTITPLTKAAAQQGLKP